MNEFEIWSSHMFPPSGETPADSSRRLVLPAIEPVGLLPYTLAGLLPNREHSSDLMALIDRLPESRSGEKNVVGLFAADPFLNCRRVAARLISKGYHQVANIPPVDGYGAEFLETLDNVAAGRIQEQQNLRQLIRSGLTLVPAVAEISFLSFALACSPRRLWVVPNFDMWRNAALQEESLLKLCDAVAMQTAVPVILACGGTGLSIEGAKAAGAKGILLEARGTTDKK